MPLYARITGTGGHLPARRLTNDEMAALLAQRGLQTSDAWIVERTGIRARHFAADGEMASDLALQASLKALAAAGRQPHEVDLIVLATSTPDMVFPSTATILQRKLHEAALAAGGQGPIGAAALDVQAVCTGFIYALTVADALIRTGGARRALVVGAEVFSRILNFDDRTTCVLFGDGAGAVVLEAVEHDGAGPGVLATDIHADGRHTGILCVPGTVAGGQVLGEPLLRMDGQAVFKLAVGVLEETARAALAKAGKAEADVDWLIPHQANIRIMYSTARKLKLPLERVVVTVDQHGNTSAASIPLALDHAVRAGWIQPGQLLLLEGVGGGFTWGSALVRY
ncbi:3-oxoacyl-acyl-carrier-protein synthase 3 [Tepidimonas alkaliphilus]|uniref:Beta-ketoacyl-[acyl-carrier-protein] synthase III n=1 Tax=Tepidimonas alkaliphilus TaxID=2588942 RepID=A0A554W563_9BURK|nr:beta-ketoacyl-ACP synthase III [Tepidimonas alkaliphilus]TSE18712.1 3-oxoacyl-acyl-carrier-protein synthase 3 [Tepidimonas alkaliphilus]